MIHDTWNNYLCTKKLHHVRTRVTRGELQDAMCVGRVAGVVTRHHGDSLPIFIDGKRSRPAA